MKTILIPSTRDTTTRLTVTPGVTYNVIVGAGGSGAANNTVNGTNGGESQFATTFASGGQGGGSGASVGGAGGQINPNAMISHPGGAGDTGSEGVPWASPLGLAVTFVNAAGGPPPNGGPSVQYGGDFIAFGGQPGSPGGTPQSYSGLPGYVLLTW